MKFNCLSIECQKTRLERPEIKHYYRNGSFFRKSDSRKIARYVCNFCHRSFSSSTVSLRRYQKVRRINTPLFRLLNSGVSQRRSALLLGVSRGTVERRFRFLAEQARDQQQEFLEIYKAQPIAGVQIDELETSEHTKCKPLSVALAVDVKSRKILGFQVNSMPAKGRLAKIALKKYGSRPDHRSYGLKQLMRNLKPIITNNCIVTSDENPNYPKQIKACLPNVKHVRIPGGRGAITGQGELRKKKHDPMFALNHTCAMLRANLNRLFRKTWCTTKTKQGLINHLSLYVLFHNQILTQNSTFFGGS